MRSQVIVVVTKSLKIERRPTGAVFQRSSLDSELKALDVEVESKLLELCYILARKCCVVSSMMILCTCRGVYLYVWKEGVAYETGIRFRGVSRVSNLNEISYGTYGWFMLY